MIKSFVLKGEKNGFVEFFESVFDTFFNPEQGKYENLDIGAGGIVTLRIVIIGLMVGFCVAAVASLYEKKLIGSFVKKLLSEDCIGRDKAKSLSELGFLKSPAIRSSLMRGTTLKRWVKCVEEDDFFVSVEEKRAEFEKNHPNERFVYPAFRRECNTMHFYIPADLKYQADVKFSTKGANVVSVILVILISIILCAALCSLIPDMLTFADNFISIVRK